MVSNFYYQFKNSPIAKAVELERDVIFRWRKIEKKIFFLVSMLFVAGFIIYRAKNLLGGFFISLVFLITSLLKDLFFETKIKNPKATGTVFDFFDFQIAKAVYYALNFSGFQGANSSTFLYFLLDDKDIKIRFIFSRLLLPLKNLKNELLQDRRNENELEPLFDEILTQKKEKIKLSTVLFYLAAKNQIFKNYLIQYELKPEDIKVTGEWIEYLEEEFLEAKKFWKWENLLKKGTLAREWTAGYTVLLDQFSFDVTKSMQKQLFRKIFAHREEVENMERILASPQKNNVLIVGEAGSGRRSMIEALARNLALGKSLPQINFKRVVFLDLPKIISVTQDTESAENILDRIFREVCFAENVILVIDDLHQYVGIETDRRAGALDISGILSSYLPSPKFLCIGITTFEGLHINLEQKPILLEMFEKIEVKEVSKEETLLILKDRALRLEMRYKTFFTFPAIKSIIELGEKYLPSLPFPEKGIEIIDELAVLASQRREKIITKKDVEQIIERKSKIPIGELQSSEKKKLINLESLIHERIVDQEEAVKEISEAMKRARTELKLRKGPIGSFLFLGPTGVGKTETAKALTEIYFGSENKMIRLDMSEFQNVSDISRLLGSSTQEGLLTTKVRENPFSLILLDEFEKAHPNILNLFLQVFDEGHLTDGMGRRVDFKNSIIIATSNAGYQIILEALREKIDWQIVKEKILRFIFEKGIFRPELINRFDAVVLFKPLERENLLLIAELLLKKVKKILAEKEIEFVITPELKEKVVELGYDIQFGARNMQRVIQDKIMNVLAQALLMDQLKRGSKITIDANTFQVVFLK